MRSSSGGGLDISKLAVTTKAQDLLKHKKIFKLITYLGWQCVPSKKDKSRFDHDPNRHAIPDNKDEPFQDLPDSSSFYPSGEQQEIFNNIVDLLSKEPRVKNKSRKRIKKIQNALLEFCRDVIGSRETRKTKQYMEAKAEAFLRQVLEPDQEWLVISPIDGLSLERRTKRGINISNQVIINRFDLRIIKDFAGNLTMNEKKRLKEGLQGKVCVPFFYNGNRSETSY